MAIYIQAVLSVAQLARGTIKALVYYRKLFSKSNCSLEISVQLRNCRFDIVSIESYGEVCNENQCKNEPHKENKDQINNACCHDVIRLPKFLLLALSIMRSACLFNLFWKEAQRPCIK